MDIVKSVSIGEGRRQECAPGFATSWEAPNRFCVPYKHMHMVPGRRAGDELRWPNDCSIFIPFVTFMSTIRLSTDCTNFGTSSDAADDDSDDAVADGAADIQELNFRVCPTSYPSLRALSRGVS